MVYGVVLPTKNSGWASESHCTTKFGCLKPDHGMFTTSQNWCRSSSIDNFAMERKIIFFVGKSWNIMEPNGWWLRKFLVYQGVSDMKEIEKDLYTERFPFRSHRFKMIPAWLEDWLPLKKMVAMTCFEVTYCTAFTNIIDTSGKGKQSGKGFKWQPWRQGKAASLSIILEVFLVTCLPVVEDVVIKYHLVISHSHGKSPFSIGKPSISMGHFPWLC